MAVLVIKWSARSPSTTYYSGNTSSNPAEIYSLFGKYYLKRTKLNKKEAGDDPFLNIDYDRECVD